MQRRKLLLAALTPFVSTLFACGGDDHDSSAQDDIVPADMPDSPRTVPDEPGVDPAGLSPLPDPIDIPVAYLTEVVARHCEAWVLLGDVPQAQVAVRFFDYEGRALGTGVTDAEGRCTLHGAVPRYVRVEADTPAGSLRAYGLTDGTHIENTITVNLFQTLLLNVAARLQAPFNVVHYAVRDYFAMGDALLEDLPADSPVLSQVLMAEDWRASGQPLATYLDALAAELVRHIDVDNHTDQRFQRGDAAGARQAPQESPDDVLPMDHIKELVAFAIDLMGDAIPAPFASALFKFFVGTGWKELSKSDKDKFGELNKRIQEVLSGIRETLEAQKQSDVLAHMLKLAARFDDFVNYHNTVRDLQVQLDAGQRSEKDFDDRMAEEQARLVERNSGAQLTAAARHFFGCDNYDGLSVIQSVITLIKLKKFYGQPSQNLFLRYLAYFALQESVAYMHWVAAVGSVARAKGQSEARVSADLALLHNQLKKIEAMIETVRVPLLPARVAIDWAHKLAWVGTCNDWTDVRDFFTADTVLYEYYDNKTKKTVKITGYGIDSYPLMRKPKDPKAKSNGVPEETILFGQWQLPTVAQVKASFYDDAKKSGKRIDQWAVGEGMSQGTPFWRFGTNSPVAVVTAQDNNGRYRKNGYWYNRGGVCALVKFENYAIDGHYWLLSCSGDYCAWNGLKWTYAFFPVTTVSDDQLNTYLPWNRAAKLASCSI